MDRDGLVVCVRRIGLRRQARNRRDVAFGQAEPFQRQTERLRILVGTAAPFGGDGRVELHWRGGVSQLDARTRALGKP